MQLQKLFDLTMGETHQRMTAQASQCSNFWEQLFQLFKRGGMEAEKR